MPNPTRFLSLKANFILQSWNRYSKIIILREYWSHFKATNRVFQRRLNEILETARTYGFQFRDNWTLILLSQNKSKASDWPTNQERPFKSGTIFTSKAYSSLSFEDREYFYSFYWPQRTWAEPLVEFYSKKFHPALKWAKNFFFVFFGQVFCGQ